MPDPKNAPSELDAAPRTKQIERYFSLIVAALLLVIATGAYLAFPVSDDAYFVLFIREHGAGSLRAAHPERPIYGWLLQTLGQLFGLGRAPYVAIAVSMWAVLAWQTWALARRLFPDDEAAAVLAPLLVLSPIVVTTQYTTLTTVLTANIPLTLGLASLLICLRPQQRLSRAAGLAVVILTAASTSLTEYGVACSIAAVALLLVLREWQGLPFLLGGTAGGYVVFRAVGNVSVRAQQDPSRQIPELIHHLPRAVFRLVGGVWHSLFGGIAAAVGDLLRQPIRDGLIPAVVGALTALAVVRLLRPDRSGTLERQYTRTGVALVLAVAVAILPIVASNQSPVSTDPYESRYLIPILPFAALATTFGLRLFVAARFRLSLAGLLGFVAGHSIALGAVHAVAEQQRLVALGALVEPRVKASAGEILVVVVPTRDRLDASDITPKVTFGWDEGAAKRLWVMTRRAAEPLFGARLKCRAPARIDTPAELHCGQRHGPLAGLLWVGDAWDEGEFSEPEAYCVTEAP
jgi:Dolichyl-phosphate-mannose-protein mannosyltransferase